MSLNNAQKNDREIAGKAITLCSMPRKLMVVPTNKCNLRCIMCHRAKNDTFSIPAETLNKIKCLLPGLEYVNWQGGEIMLVSGLLDLINEVSEFENIKQEITTNGLLVCGDWAETIVRRSISLQFSIDGFDRNTYESIRVGGDFGTLTDNLEKLCRLESKLNKRVRKTMLVVVMRSNFQSLEYSIPFAKKYGFCRVELWPVHSIAGEENIFMDTNEHLLGALREKEAAVEKAASENGIEFFSALPGKKAYGSGQVPENLFCVLPWVKMMIDANGKIYPECRCKVPVGSIYDKENLLEVWNGILMQEYRRNIVNSTMQGLCAKECVNNLTLGYQKQ